MDHLDRLDVHLKGDEVGLPSLQEEERQHEEFVYQDEATDSRRSAVRRLQRSRETNGNQPSCELRLGHTS